MDINTLAIPRFSPSTMSESEQIKLFNISGGKKNKKQKKLVKFRSPCFFFRMIDV